MFIKSTPSLRDQGLVSLRSKQKNLHRTESFDGKRSRWQASNRKINDLTNDDKNKVLMASFSQPLWLKALFLVQKGSFLLCLIMIASILGVYGMTVSAPQLWTKDFKKLQDLQKDERQITSQNEVIIDQLAKQASKSGTGLVNPDPTKQPIFLPETEPKDLLLNNVLPPKLKPPEVLSPLAY